MDAQLELIIKLSNELDERIFLETLNKLKKINFFIKGDFSANRLYITLSGDRELSKIVFKIIEELEDFLRRYNLGVRDFYVPSYEISFPCGFVGKVKIPVAKAVVCNGEICRLVFRDLEKEFLKNNIAERSISLVKNKVSKKEEKLVFENNLEIKTEKDPVQEIVKQRFAKKGIIKGENIYLPKGSKKISGLREKILIELKKEFKAEEIFVPLFTPLNILEKNDVVELIPKEIFSKYVTKPVNLKQVYEFYYLTGKVPRAETKNIGLLYNEIPLTLYKALESTTTDKQFFYYLDYLKLNFVFFDNPENYNNTKDKIVEFFKNLVEGFGLKYRVVMKEIDGKEFLKFESYQPFNKKWMGCIEIFFSEEGYTKPFKIKGKSGQGTINLENLFLSILSYKEE